MQRNAQRIAALVAGVPDEQARWKPDAESWSILEVVNHLLDEEREDFRVRIDYTLHRPGEKWP
ncbi:MAG: DinB family protein, partial [Caldilineaceae bacterium]|nr:DinB family protein [Caldilineaceae bacterium]